MAKYLIFESRDPYDSADSEYFAELVRGLADRGNEATLVLVQNGVLPARKGAKYNDALTTLLQSKVKVLADGFSLRERAIEKLVDGVEIVDVDQLVDLLVEPGTKAIWH